MTFASRALEFDKILARLAQHASFSAGRQLALALEPSADAAEAEAGQSGTAEALKLADLKPDLTLSGARDVRPQVGRAGIGGILLPEELLEIGSVVRCARRWRSTLTRLDELFPVLASSGRKLSDHRPVLESIEAAISENGEVVDAASPELRRIRSTTRTLQERVRNRLQEIISSGARTALQEPIITERGGRYVVPVKAEFRARLKGIVHDQSASGATLFVEPLEVVELSNQLRQLQVEEQREIERILRVLSGGVALQSAELEETVVGLAELDLQVAKSRLAADMKATRPALHDLSKREPGRPVVRLIRARHPLLGPGAVPLDLELGTDFDMLIITGPNTGGKTVALKTLGVLVLMAQAGLHLPANDGCVISAFRSVHADIGDEQSIEQSLSTFSSHVSHIVEMLRDADDMSLVLLDEIGAGTDPQEGSALARALLEHLRQRRSYCVATTHYSDLKLYAHSAPRVQNASVEFDPRTLSPTYRLLIGVPGRSNALDIAARLGLPRVVVDRARASLDPADVEASALLTSIQEERQTAENARLEVERERQAAVDTRHRLEQELAEQERQRENVWREARRASDEMLGELRREIAALRQEAQRGRVDPDAAQRISTRATQLKPVPLPVHQPPSGARAGVSIEPEVAKQPLRVGSELLVPGLGVPGRVTRLEPEEAEMDVGGMRVRLKRSDLADAQPTPGRSSPTSEEPSRVILSNPDQQVALQLDLRGQRRDEAALELDRYLNDAYMAGLKSVRVVHGKGTGAVRQAVHELLGDHPLVRRYNTAAPQAGGDGATEVELVV